MTKKSTSKNNFVTSKYSSSCFFSCPCASRDEFLLASFITAGLLGNNELGEFDGKNKGKNW